MTNLDRIIFHYFGGMNSNSLRNVLKIHMDINDDKMQNELNIMYSSYCQYS